MILLIFAIICSLILITNQETIWDDIMAFIKKIPECQIQQVYIDFLYDNSKKSKALTTLEYDNFAPIAQVVGLL